MLDLQEKRRGCPAFADNFFISSRYTMAVREHKFFSLHGQTVVTNGLQGFHKGLPACGMSAWCLLTRLGNGEREKGVV